jgi:hypothetical protein
MSKINNITDIPVCVTNQNLALTLLQLRQMLQRGEDVRFVFYALPLVGFIFSRTGVRRFGHGLAVVIVIDRLFNQSITFWEQNRSVSRKGGGLLNTTEQVSTLDFHFGSISLFSVVEENHQ